MVYIKKFLMFSLICVGIVVLLIISTIMAGWLEQQSATTNFSILIAVIAVIAIIDVQVDKYLAKKRAELTKDINKEIEKANKLIREYNKGRNNATSTD